MQVEIGNWIVLFTSVAVVSKLIDYFLSDSDRRVFSKYLLDFIDSRDPYFDRFWRLPFLSFKSFLSWSIVNVNDQKKASVNRTFIASVILVFGSLAMSGIINNTFMGFEDPMGTSYENSVSLR